MFTRYTQGKCLYGLAIGIIFLIMIFANSFAAFAEDSSNVIVNESSDPKPDSDKSIRSRAEINGGNSKFKTGIKTAPIENTSSAINTSDAANGEQQRAFPEMSGIAQKIQNKSISIDVKSGNKIEVGTKGMSKAIKMLPMNQTEQGSKKIESKMGPTKDIHTKDTGEIQQPIRDSVKVTGVQSWKLDNSGNKTNEATTDNMRVIKEINQAPPDLNKQ